MRFCVSPLEIKGNGKVESVVLGKNGLVPNEKGDLKPVATGETEEIKIGLIFRSVGYRGYPLPDVPFDEKRGTIPNDKGRVLTAPQSGQTVTGDYAVGWIKRGPSGIIGTNKPDSVETVDCLLEDCKAGKLLQPTAPDGEAIVKLLEQRNALCDLPRLASAGHR
ncbi:MAG: hypothetical protein R3E39_29395 [Anaerolineae bacterium]